MESCRGNGRRSENATYCIPRESSIYLFYRRLPAIRAVWRLDRNEWHPPSRVIDLVSIDAVRGVPLDETVLDLIRHSESKPSVTMNFEIKVLQPRAAELVEKRVFPAEERGIAKPPPWAAFDPARGE
jgi:hypothetical protein